jgi:hypothetical protein
MGLSICLDTQQVRIGLTKGFTSSTAIKSHPEAPPPINISQPSKPQSSTVTSIGANGLNAHEMTMMGQEQSLLHHLVVWLALMVQSLQHAEATISTADRCIEQSIGNKV